MCVCLKENNKYKRTNFVEQERHYPLLQQKWDVWVIHSAPYTLAQDKSLYVDNTDDIWKCLTNDIHLCVANRRHAPSVDPKLQARLKFADTHTYSIQRDSDTDKTKRHSYRNIPFIPKSGEWCADFLSNRPCDLTSKYSQMSMSYHVSFPFGRFKHM